MPFTLCELQKTYKDKNFFTSDRWVIEYLLEKNLTALEEYALLVSQGNVYLFSPEKIVIREVQVQEYCSYSNKRYQDKIKNIQKLLTDFLVGNEVHVMNERLEYINYFQEKKSFFKDVTKEMTYAARIKTKEQIKAIEYCVLCNQEIYKAIKNNYLDGKNELAIWKDIRCALYRKTGYSNELIFDLLSGKRTIEVSGMPNNYVPKRGDTLIADLLPREKGVFADTTRTFFIGEPTKRQMDIYAIVQGALENGKRLLKPGISAKQIYGEIKKSLGQYGTNNNFPHHAGHGLGMGYYEAPYLLEEETDRLEEGMIIALEPGIYLKDEFGIRIEDNYVITKNGAEKLGNIPTSIEEFICV